MSDAQAFSFKNYSLSPMDLIDDDVEPELEVDARWVHYCELSSQLDTDDLMATVADTFSQTDLLRALIEECKEKPFLPDERKRLHINDCIRLGELVMTLIAQAQDDAVSMRMATEVVDG